MTDGLRPALGPWQFFSFAFGTVVGVGWVVLLGDWLQRAGPVGAILGFIIGGGLMVLIGLCYGEAATMFPVSGGEVAYARGAFGSPLAFAIGWALALPYIGAVAYTASSLAWIVDYLIPGLQGPALYSFRNTPIHAGSLLVALSTVGAFTWINWRGVKSSGRFQDFFTYSKLGIALLFILAGIFGGKVANLDPPFSSTGGRSPMGGVLAMIAVVPWFLGGFNTISQVMEEKSQATALKSIGRIIALSIALGAVFYSLVILSASMATPWQGLLSQELPTAAAFRVAFGSELLARMVLLTGLFGIATVGNGCFVGVTRVLFALSRASLLGPGFRHVHPKTGVPDRAVLFTGCIGALGTLLGRQGIGPIVTLGAVGLALGYLVTTAAMWRLRFREPDRPRPYRVPLGSLVLPVAMVGSAGLVFAAVRDPWANAGRQFPLEWGLLVGWAVLGMLLWFSRAEKKVGAGQTDRSQEPVG